MTDDHKQLVERLRISARRQEAHGGLLDNEPAALLKQAADTIERLEQQRERDAAVLEEKRHEVEAIRTHAAVAEAWIKKNEDQDRFIEKVREVAGDCGYAVAIHGSRTRDLDLVAVPWTANAINPHQFVKALIERCDLWLKPEEPELMENPERKPNGRIAWALMGAVGAEYLDLSVFA